MGQMPNWSMPMAALLCTAQRGMAILIALVTYWTMVPMLPSIEETTR
jgi:hypothetical protein